MQATSESIASAVPSHTRPKATAIFKRRPAVVLGALSLGIVVARYWFAATRPGVNAAVAARIAIDLRCPRTEESRLTDAFAAAEHVLWSHMQKPRVT